MSNISDIRDVNMESEPKVEGGESSIDALEQPKTKKRRKKVVIGE